MNNSNAEPESVVHEQCEPTGWTESSCPALWSRHRWGQSEGGQETLSGIRRGCWQGCRNQRSAETTACCQPPTLGWEGRRRRPQGQWWWGRGTQRESGTQSGRSLRRKTGGQGGFDWMSGDSSVLPAHLWPSSFSLYEGGGTSRPRRRPHASELSATRKHTLYKTEQKPDSSSEEQTHKGLNTTCDVGFSNCKAALKKNRSYVSMKHGINLT